MKTYGAMKTAGDGRIIKTINNKKDMENWISRYNELADCNGATKVVLVDVTELRKKGCNV